MLSATALSLLLALASDASAMVLPRESPLCTFSMNALGGLNGTVNQDSIGEPRIGGGFSQGTFLITNETMTDSLNHTCLIQSNSSQLVCTTGLPGTQFSFSDNFLVLNSETNSSWLACPADGPGTDGGYNIYTTDKEDQTECEAIELQAGGFGCAALGGGGASPTSTASGTATSTSVPSSTSTASASCPTTFPSDNFQFPHLIVLTSNESPNTSFGNSFKAYISPINTTLFNFDIPTTAPYTGTCSLLFLFPFASDLDPSAGTYYFSGIEEEEGENGGLDFALLSGVADNSTTYTTTPSIKTDYGKTEIIPGNNYTIATFPCAQETPITISATSVGNVELDYFQDSAPSPIGLYIVPCS